MSVLRYYKMAECDEHGVPLDWDECRACKGTGKAWPVTIAATQGKCGTCDGHGSLKAAALDRAGYRAATKVISPYVMTIQDWRSGTTSIATSGRVIEFGPLPIRCEDCGHPMSEGTWDHGLPMQVDPIKDRRKSRAERDALHDFRCGIPTTIFCGLVHYSPCDEGCRHGEPGRIFAEPEASWRQVGVRTLDWPHDLRPESLAVLCLRCWAERSKDR